MRELTSKEVELVNTLGLPINALEIPLESCSCGDLDCHEHETWSTVLLRKIFDGFDAPELPKGWLDALIAQKRPGAYFD